MRERVVVIGAGAVGLFSAYYHAKEGHEVVVFERGQPSDENCSCGNAGMIVPSHFTPLASPGMLKLGLSMLLRGDSPLAIRRPFSRETMSWVWAFLRSANKEHVKVSQERILALNLASKKAYIEFAKEHDIGLSTAGLLMICKTSKALDDEGHLASRAIELGLRATVLDAAQLRALEPEIEINALGAVLYKDDAFVSPTRVIAALRQTVPEIRFGCEVLSATSSLRSLKSLATNQGEFKADRFVLAAGAWSGRVGRKLGARVNVLPGKGYGFWATREPVKMRHCAILVESRVAVTPMPEGLRCTGVMELGSFDRNISVKRLLAVRKAVGDYLPNFREGALFAEPVWVGHRPCSPSGIPYLGPSKEFDNLILATGHGMMGMSLAALKGSR